jgi:hypothetical protein
VGYRLLLTVGGERCREHGARAGFAMHCDFAAMAGDNAMHDRQPQAGALADILGRKERLEDAVEPRCRDAGSGIRNRQVDNRLNRSLLGEAWLSPATQMRTVIVPITPPIAGAALVTRLTTTWCSPTESPKTGGTPLICSMIWTVAGKLALIMRSASGSTMARSTGCLTRSCLRAKLRIYSTGSWARPLAWLMASISPRIGWSCGKSSNASLDNARIGTSVLLSSCANPARESTERL